MEALDEPYLETGFFKLVKKRAGWLAILFLGEMLTATALGYFEGELDKAVVLALFLPLIISSGGNSGSQATTLVIRAMALGEVALRDWFRVIRRELFAGIALGCILAVIGMSTDFCLARDVRIVWPTLHRIGAHDCVQPRRRSDVWDAGGVDVALHPEACRAGSGERVSSVCCNASRRHRTDNLFHGSEGCAHGYAIVTRWRQPQIFTRRPPMYGRSLRKEISAIRKGFRPSSQQSGPHCGKFCSSLVRDTSRCFYAAKT